MPESDEADAEPGQVMAENVTVCGRVDILPQRIIGAPVIKLGLRPFDFKAQVEGEPLQVRQALCC
jgi:hypothetical protein